ARCPSARPSGLRRNQRSRTRRLRRRRSRARAGSSRREGTPTPGGPAPGGPGRPHPPPPPQGGGGGGRQRAGPARWPFSAQRRGPPFRLALHETPLVAWLADERGHADRDEDTGDLDSELGDVARRRIRREPRRVLLVHAREVRRVGQEHTHL